MLKSLVQLPGIDWIVAIVIAFGVTICGIAYKKIKDEEDK